MTRRSPRPACQSADAFEPQCLALATGHCRTEVRRRTVFRGLRSSAVARLVIGGMRSPTSRMIKVDTHAPGPVAFPKAE